MSKVLKLEDKLNMVLSRDKSLRDIAKEYNVHHSTIDDVFKESKRMLNDGWKKKSERGNRNEKDEKDVNIELLNKKVCELEKETVLKQFEIDYLNLKLEWQQDRGGKAVGKNTHLKKKRKRS